MMIPRTTRTVRSLHRPFGNVPLGRHTLNVIQFVPNLLPLPISFLTILTSTLCEVTCNLVYQEISINDWVVLFSFGTILCALTLLKTTSSCEYFDVRIEVRLKEEWNARGKSERETS